MYRNLILKLSIKLVSVKPILIQAGLTSNQYLDKTIKLTKSTNNNNSQKKNRFLLKNFYYRL
jgi:hypothetical protein